MLPLLPVVDATLRGMLLAWLLLLALVLALARDRPRLTAARAGVLMTLGSCVQVVGSTPLFKDRLAWRLLRLAVTEWFPAHAGPVVSSADPRAAGTLAAAPVDDLPATPLPAPDETERRLAVALQRLMADERAYRSEDLSLASLAAQLAVPDYRLRRLINQRLGHRNFNVFVNGFRLAEARAALADPAKTDRPVLSIALDAGFQSIGPFNRAFKADTGRTPTEFRRENRADC